MEFDGKNKFNTLKKNGKINSFFIEATFLLQSKNPEEKCQLYRRRWLMLAIYVLCEISGAIIILQYASIEKTAMEYYNASHTEVSWAFLIVMFVYSIFVFPSTYVIHKLVIM